MKGGMGSRILQDITSVPLPLPLYIPLIQYFAHYWRSSKYKREAMSNKLLRMLAALMCVLAAGADVTPVKDFNLEKVRQKEKYFNCTAPLLSLHNSE